jgi:glycosyltransferase involved in cell wall biosynthesis
MDINLDYKMNILQIGSQNLDSGGVGSYIKSIVENSNLVNYFICSKSDFPSSSSLNVIEFDVSYKVNYLIKRIKQLKKIIEIYNIDVIHAHTQRAGFLVAILSLFKKVKIVYTPHGLRHTQTSGVKMQMHHLIELFIMFRVSIMTAITDLEVDKLKPFSKKVYKINSLIDLNYIPSHISFEDFFQVRGRKVIAMVGSVNTRKQPSLFLDIAKQIQDENICFVWIGGGEDLDFYRKKIQESNLQYKVYFIGDVNRSVLYSLLKQIEFFLMTSSNEGFPLSILESYYFGKTVVSNNFKGVGEIVLHNDNGLIFDYNNIGEASRLIMELLEDRVSQSRMEESGVDFVKPYLCADRFKSEYVDIYQKAMISND